MDAFSTNHSSLCHPPWSRARARLRALFCAAVLGACSNASVSGEENLASRSDRATFIPPSELSNPNGVLVPPEVQYDKQRDVWDDENPVPGEDAYRLTGWQWLRSYAQQATVALMPIKNIECATCKDPNDPDLVLFNNQPPHGQKKNLCSDQHFLDQPTSAYCSGTLIDDNLILTAGHCLRHEDQFAHDDPANGIIKANHSILIDDSQKCAMGADGKPDTYERKRGKIENLRVVFNYFNPGSGERPRVSRSKDVFRVREVAWSNRVSGDISLLQIVDAAGAPLSVRPRFHPVPLLAPFQNLTAGSPLAKIGTPMGIPLKIAAGKTTGVVATADGFVLRHRLDAYGGDSGGGIYDIGTHSLVATVHEGFGFNMKFKCNGPYPPKICLDDCTNQGMVDEDWKNQTEDVFPTPLCNRVMYFNPTNADMDQAKATLESMGLLVESVGPTAGNGQTAYSIDIARVVLCGGWYREVWNQLVAQALPSPEAQGIVDAWTTNPESAWNWDPTYIQASRLCKEPPSVSEPSYADLERVELVHGREVTLHGDTFLRLKVPSLPWSCGEAPGTGDALFRLTVDKQAILYVDTFNSDIPAIVALYQVDWTDPSPAHWVYQGCHYGSACGADLSSAAQGLFFLYPGDYVLVVTGRQGVDGRFNLHLQSVPGSRHGELLEFTQDGTSQFLDRRGTNLPLDPSDVNGHDAPRCRSKEVAGAREYQYVMMSCPDFPGGAFQAATLSPYTDYDTVVALWDGHQLQGGGYMCNDDHGIDLLDLWFPQLALQSLLGGFPPVGNLGTRPPTWVSSGGGIRSLYVDGYYSYSEGNFHFRATLPSSIAITAPQPKTSW
jgi:hypothetical protein